MLFISDFWSKITIPQASIVGSIITAIAALIAVLVGSKLLEGRIKDLKGAIEQSDKLIKEHRQTVETTIDAIGHEMKDFSAQIASISESIGKIGGSVNDIAASSSLPSGLSENQVDARTELRADWEIIRDRLEEIAASHNDGRTRARYGRIDRRRYDDLIFALKNDGMLSGNASKFSDALEIWNKFKNGRNTPAADELKKMSQLRAFIVN